MRSRYALIAPVLTAVLLGCSGSKHATAPPPPPDDPTPPKLAQEPEFFASRQTILLIPPVEDLVVEIVTVGFDRPGASGQPMSTDFPGATLVHQGDSLAVHVAAGWTWQSGDIYTLGVRVRRPGQHLTFPLCCAPCGGDGGYLQSGPCSLGAAAPHH